MRSRLHRTLVAFMMLGILCTGPVAACICADAPMPPMPCCPDDAGSGHDHHALGAAADDAGCAATSIEQASGAKYDGMPLMAAVSHAAPIATLPRPIRLSSAPRLKPHPSPPIYLVTLRLRH
jgi:hypothetical protein